MHSGSQATSTRTWPTHGTCSTSAWFSLRGSRYSSRSLVTSPLYERFALRPLRSISRLPEMRKMVHALLGSLPALMDALMLTAFFLVIAGVLGVQLFAGTLRRRCSVAQLGPLGSGAPPLQLELLTGVCADDAACKDGGTCLWYGENPNAGTLSFDTILQAWMTLSQVVTLEGWTDVALVLQHVGGVPGGVYVYSVVGLGSFYVLNLLFVVTWQSYMSQQAKMPKAVATATPVVLDTAAAPATAPTALAAAASFKKRSFKARRRASIGGRRVSTLFDFHVPGRVRANWVHSFLVQDPRHQIARYFKPGDHRGPLGYLLDHRLRPRVDQHSSFFSVWRPTSMDAIRMMMEGRATGKPLTVKGKSALSGELSGFVPFLQIYQRGGAQGPRGHFSQGGADPRLLLDRRGECGGAHRGAAGAEGDGAGVRAGREAAGRRDGGPRRDRRR